MHLDRLLIGEVASKIGRRLPFLSSLCQLAVRFIIPRENLRARLNAYYQKIGPNTRRVTYTLAGSAFKGRQVDPFQCLWPVKFLDSKIQLPIDNETAWLDWDQAVAILGHDVEVTTTYEILMRSAYRPKVFFDIGANYGTHSLLFLSQDVLVTSFEPNPVCVAQLETFCKLNEFTSNIESVAVGDRDGVATLWFPEHETWLGTLVSSVRDDVSASRELVKLEVPVISLDSYVERSNIHPDLVKIDTEGNEPSVLRGAAKTIKADAPIIIFECGKQQDKRELFQFFQDLEYIVCTLPLDKTLRLTVLDLDRFERFHRTNFLAVPISHPIVAHQSAG